MEKTTEENNKLMKEFYYADNGEHPKIEGSLPFGNYHNSWDWTMPVVDKINGLLDENGEFLFEVEIRPSRCVIETMLDSKYGFSEIVRQVHGKDSREVVVLAVVEFIKWYKENK